MPGFLILLAQLSVLAFVIAGMLTMGLSLTVKEIVQPLRKASLVIKALLVNFVVTPVLALLLVRLFNLEEPLAIGMILIATAAGAPFLPKLIQVAKGNIAFGVGLMTMLMIVTIVYMPLVLPFFLPDVEVDSLKIATSLVVTMLLPLGIGLFIKARYERLTKWLRPIMNQTSNIALILLMILMLVLNFESFTGAFGSGAILTAALFIAVTFFLGYLLGGPKKSHRSAMALGAGQRNLAAATVVAVGNFTDPDVLTMILIVGFIGLILLMLAGGEIGKRAEKKA